MSEAASDIADLIAPLVAFRRDIHAHPELGFAEHRTSSKIAEALREIGLEVHTGIGGTGVVGVLRAGNSDRRIALRADMDALPIREETGLAYASQTAGIFHGCGHDGHVAMLLGAARHLARTRRFDGTVNFIFQPAEEGLGGARAMIEAGLFDLCPTDEVYALHNWPDLPAGTAQTRAGPIMAAADKFEISLEGRGGHAAMPHQTPDAILAASHLVTQLNSIISRRIPPTSSAVLSVTKIEGGHAHNVLPAVVRVTGTVRSFEPEVQDTIEAALRDVVAGIATAYGVKPAIVYDRYYPATINHPEAAAEALAAAKCACCQADTAPAPAFTSEDFAFMLQARKGAYIWLGQSREGEHTPLHHPRYDFNDEVIPTGIRLHSAIVERLLAA
ncbi:M20 aminoacylase family protein [Phenylobacterium sp.]|jgi:hippurate hydrolase|uniref:M20 aminoacylase family protein n=1 Tax=Phenylobacterium sp. TaxID=1871053 RepID=UPI002EDB215F